jgi:hypothetical protein
MSFRKNSLAKNLNLEMSNSTITVVLVGGIALIAFFYIILTAKRKVVLGIMGAILLVAILTNPGREDHAAAVSHFIMNKTSNSISSPGELLGASLASNLIKNMVTVDNYLVCSITIATIGGKSKAIGIGAFGNVWIWNNASVG